MQQAQPWETKLFDGFEGQDFSPDGGLYYRENFEQSAGTVEFQSIVKRNGNGATQAERRADLSGFARRLQ